jgi:AcrR family transcriptional regulator
VVRLAGVGRSTFYEFFDSPEHLLEQLTARTRRALAASLEAGIGLAHTPLERVRAISRVWLEELCARPSEARVALTLRAPSDLLSPAGQTLLDALSRAVASALALQVGWLSAEDDSNLLAAAAAVEAVTRKHLAGPALPDAPRVLSEIISRLLR